MSRVVAVLILVCISVIMVIIHFGLVPAIEKNAECCKEVKAQMAQIAPVSDYYRKSIEGYQEEVRVYQEQVKRLVAGNERLTQEVIELKRRLPIKWRAK